jgi:hypothetical protein
MNKRALTTIDSLVELLAQDMSSFNAIQEVEAQASGEYVEQDGNSYCEIQNRN